MFLFSSVLRVNEDQTSAKHQITSPSFISNQPGGVQYLIMKKKESRITLSYAPPYGEST